MGQPTYHARVDLGIAGKVALVTAGTKGIGLGIAHALAAEGVRVAVAARTGVDVKRRAESLTGLGVVADLLPRPRSPLPFRGTHHLLPPLHILTHYPLAR